MLYRVLIGLHREGGRTYQTGELVFSRTDLTRLNRGGPPKFEVSCGNTLPGWGLISPSEHRSPR